MSTEAIIDIVLLVAFVIATAVFLKWGGKEYEYDKDGNLVEVKDADEAGADAGADRVALV